MVDDAIGDLFVCEDYTLETFQFNGNHLPLLKALLHKIYHKNSTV